MRLRFTELFRDWRQGVLRRLGGVFVDSPFCTISSMRIFFDESSLPADFWSSLSSRQQRLLEGALNYHSLIQPGRTLEYRIYMGEKWQYPRLCDVSTVDGSCTANSGMKPVVTFRMTSHVENQSEYPLHYFNGNRQLVDSGVRHILLTPDDATDADVQARWPRASIKRRVYQSCEQRAPVAFDYVREALRIEREHHTMQPIPLYSAFESEPPRVPGTRPLVVNGLPWWECPPGPKVEGAPKAVIIAMHWLQSGGAERWGMETIRLVKEAGMLPIVITDRDSQQPWITSSECDGALVLPLIRPLQERVGDIPILRALFEQFDVRGIAIHHCQWMYDRLWWVKKYFPHVPVVDSLHIVEYVMQGGYPREAIAHDRWIDLHHVISPQIEHWMVDVHHIDPKKVVDAPLIGMTADPSDMSFRPRCNGKALTVLFVGRITRQKRPEAFLLTARELQRKYPGRFRFIMQGSGEMEPFVDGLIAKYGLGRIVERRPDKLPVSQAYEQSDVLLVTSINEGITLTAMEAISEGIPVLSANVGSQKTLIPPQGLLPRRTDSLVGCATRSLAHILENENDRERLWLAERDRLSAFAQLQSADSLFRDLFAKWSM